MRSEWCFPALPLALLASSCDRGHAGSPPRPNVVLIVVDTLRADRLGAYGYERATSPRLDRLAEEGVVFEDVNAQSSWTRPSMVSLFSGRYLTAYQDLLFEDAPTLAETFQSAGYRTFGSVSNILLSAEFGFGRGFDEYDERRSAGGIGFSNLGRSAPALVEDLLATLAADQGEGPFLVYAHFMDPHHPYEEHPQLEEELGESSAPELGEWAQHTYYGEAGEYAFQADVVADAFDAIRTEREYYDHEVRYVDQAIGSLLDGLEAQGLLDNAVVAVVSDHGEALYEQVNPRERWGPYEDRGGLAPNLLLQRAHGLNLSQSLVATPFVLWGLGLPPGARVKTAVENIDLLPTLLQLADIPPPRGLHGKSLVPWIESGPGEPPHEFVYAYVMQQRMVREVQTGWKLIVPNPPFSTYEHYPVRLYHVPSDPFERDDRARLEPRVVERLRAALDQWMTTHPIEGNEGRQPTRAELNALRALGYIDDDATSVPDSAR